jgi:hypothetical protein
MSEINYEEFDASKASSLTHEFVYSNEYKKIIEIIAKSAKEGNTSVSTNIDLTEYSLELLKAKGFKIYPTPSHSVTFYKIEWNTNKN